MQAESRNFSSLIRNYLKVYFWLPIELKAAFSRILVDFENASLILVYICTLTRNERKKAVKIKSAEFESLELSIGTFKKELLPKVSELKHKLHAMRETRSRHWKNRFQ